MTEKMCLVCFQTIKNRNYRAVMSQQCVALQPHIIKVTEIKPDKTHFLCTQCFAKLNRLDKIEQELSGRISRLNEEAKEIVAKLQAQSRSGALPRTPTRLSGTSKTKSPASLPVRQAPQAQLQYFKPCEVPGKRRLLKTPTPKKMVKRAMFHTPARSGKSMSRVQLLLPMQDCTTESETELAKQLPKISHDSQPRANKQTQVGSGLEVDPVGTVKVD